MAANSSDLFLDTEFDIDSSLPLISRIPTNNHNNISQLPLKHDSHVSNIVEHCPNALDFDSNITMVDCCWPNLNSKRYDPDEFKSSDFASIIKTSSQESCFHSNLDFLSYDSSLGTNLYDSENDTPDQNSSLFPSENSSCIGIADFSDSSVSDPVFKIDSYCDENSSPYSMCSPCSSASDDILFFDDFKQLDPESKSGFKISDSLDTNDINISSKSQKIISNIPVQNRQAITNSIELQISDLESPFAQSNLNCDEYLIDCINHIALQIENGEIKSHELSELINSKNLHYIFDKPSLARAKKSKKKITSLVKDSKRGIQYLLVLKSIKGLILDQKFVRRRDLFYKNISKFVSQRQMDRICVSLESFFQVSPFDLRVMASPNGLISGPIQVTTKQGKIIDYRLDTFQGMLIPDANSISFISPHEKLKHVLIIEKETVFLNLLQSDLFRSSEYLLITGKGYPSNNTRDFLNVLSVFLKFKKIGWYVLTDNDPHGAHIYQVYYEHSFKINQKHTLPKKSINRNKLVWLGLHSSDRSR
ncbi:Meiotic recombination protein SPO11-1 [Smittium culicis]|uniref:DNA topoisomerase (ATP-hydrolyzing) n=1 Tax=Smittium culicis TaxID=133412 RepID=A0A1R1YRY3_9FUNG|nr:Meiotic recombination protein SPO11-1 [Smittium culicis]